MEILEVCGLKAAEGEKVSAMVDVPGTAGSQIPVTIINGAKEGKTVLITGGLHSCEYVGTQAAIELAREIQPGQLAGALIICHPLNLSGFRARIEADVAEDRKNLNRIFPGDPNGTTADIIAYVQSTEFQAQSDFYMDLHGGEIFDEMTPHAYFTANAAPEVNRISREALDYVDVSYLYRSVATTGAYNSAAVHQGVPSIIIERGGQGMWNREEVDAMKADVCNVLRYLQVLEGEAKKVERQQWETIRNEYPTAAEIGYCWYPAVKTGEKIQKGQKYGEVRDFFGNLLKTYYCECDGVVLWVTSSLVVPGHGGLGCYVELAE